jgi:hypothetical protein
MGQTCRAAAAGDTDYIGQSAVPADARYTSLTATTALVLGTLHHKGYDIADTGGRKMTDEEICAVETADGVGILKPNTPRSGFLSYWVRSRRRLLGTLWLDCAERGAVLDREWVMEVYGEDNIKEAEHIIGDLLDQAHVPVLVRLASKKPRFEETRL